MNNHMMRWLAALAAASLLAVPPALAAPPASKAQSNRTAAGKRPAAKPAARKARPTLPRAPAPPVTPGIMIPKAVTLTGLTPAEQAAHAIWSLRAALNVAALQCQYSPFLRTVDNYNQLLRKHGEQLAGAQTMMIGYFTRRPRAGGLAGFDRYNTRSYNSFSTLDAQYNFCWAAAQAGQSVRMADVGALAQVAPPLLAQVRAALGHVPAAAGLNVPATPPLPIDPLPIFPAD